MKKRLFLRTLSALLLLAICFILPACESAPKAPSEYTTADTQPTPCEHVYSAAVEEEALALRDGLVRYTCDMCADTYTEVIPATKSLKILAIGNSFSTDSLEYLWEICESGGVETVITGHLNIGGCSLDTHWKNMSENLPAYKFYLNTSGTKELTPDSTAEFGIKAQDWDIIVIQQVSGQSGLKDTYGALDSIVTYLEETKTNPNAKILWHATWAYQQNSSHADFAKYEKDQMTMYQAILDAAADVALADTRIDGVIPTGTAVQNVRTSYLGDTLTRDGYHLSQSHGRYLAALTWFVATTGGDPANVSYVPPAQEVIRADLPLLWEAAANAVASPWEVTPSSFTDAADTAA